MDSALFPLSSSSHSFGRSRFIIIITIHLPRPRPPARSRATDAGARNEPSINQDNIRRARAASDPGSERAGGPEQARWRCQPHRCQCHLAPSRRPPSRPHTSIRSENVIGASGGENVNLGTYLEYREDMNCSNQIPTRIFTVESTRDHIARRQSGA